MLDTSIVGKPQPMPINNFNFCVNFIIIEPKKLNVILLGPCHKTHLPHCGLSNLELYETPFGFLE